MSTLDLEPARRRREVPGWLAGLWAVAGRELLSLFVTPLAYVVGTLFLLLQGWNFALLLRVLNDPLAAAGPVMQFYFGGSFFIFWLPVLFLCSTISMRLVAEENKQGTLEALLTAPLSPAQVVVGKYLGALGFYGALWLPTAVFYVLLRGAGVQPDPGPVLSGYLGTALVGASFLALGLLTSALTRSQLTAAIGSFVACTIVLLAGLLADEVESETLAEVLRRTSLLSMIQELAQGIVDGRWLWLHGAVVVVSLAAAVVVVDPRRGRQRVVQWVLLSVAVGHIAWAGARHSERDDWTGGRKYSLSDRAQQVLEALPGPVDVRVLVPSTIGGGRPNPLAQELREVLGRMAAITPRLRVRLLDPDRDRQDAEQWVAQFGLGGRDLADGVVLVRAGQGAQLRKTHLLPGDLVTYATGPDVQATGPRVQEFRGEEALLLAFLRVSDPTPTIVCHTQGHGEAPFDDLQPFGGYAHLDRLLRRANLTVRPADLDAAEGLRGCDVLLVAGPGGVLPPAHVRAAERFAEQGGALLLLTGAVVRPGATGLAEHGLEPLVARYGIRYGDRVVLDPHAMPGGTPLLSFTLIDGWGDHPAVRALVGRPVSFVLARELSVQPVPDAEAPAVLVSVGEQGWAESDIAALRSGDAVEPDPERDRMGPVPVAVAGQRGGSRLVVVGSDQFALNAYLREDIVYDHGRDLILNAVGWLTDREALLGIRPRAREHVKLVLLPQQLERMTLVCLLGLPGFGILLGIWVLGRRRRRR
ncbi:MAG: Gldg family protein [Myxococcota bacterium]